MKSQLLYAALAAVGLMTAFTACEKTPVAEPVPDPVLELSQTSVAVPEEGGSFSVAYKLTNPVDGEEVQAAFETAVDWVSDLAVDPDASTVSFTVAASEVAAERTATVNVTYEGAEDCSFNIVQAAKVFPFTIDVKNIGTTTITVDVKPSDPDMTYVLMSVSKAYLENYGLDTDDAIFEDDMAYFDYLIAMYNQFGISYTLEDFLSRGDQLDYTFGSLNAATDMVIYAYGVDTETATRSTEIVYAYVTTATPEPSAMTIDITVENVTGRAATISVTPSNEEESFVAIITHADKVAGLSEDEAIEYFCENYDLNDAPGAFSETLSGLDPETEYGVYAFGVEGGYPTTGLFSATFTTLEAVDSDIEFSLVCDKVYSLEDYIEAFPDYAYVYQSYLDNGMPLYLPCEAVTNPETSNFYWGLFTDSLETLMYFGEDELRSFLVSNGYSYRAAAFCIPENTEYTVVGFAIDDEGNWGHVWSTVISYSLADVSDISDLTASQSAAATQSYKEVAGKYSVGVPATLPDLTKGRILSEQKSDMQKLQAMSNVKTERSK